MTGTKRGAWIAVISAETPSETHNAPRFYLHALDLDLPSNEGYVYQRGTRKNEDQQDAHFERVGPDWLGCEPDVHTSHRTDGRIHTYWQPGSCSMYQPHYTIPADLAIQGRRLRLLPLVRWWRDGGIEESV